MTKKTILVVDDDKTNLLMAQKVLAEEYRVAVVNSGKMAFQYLEKNEPVVILLDIQMPEMDGFEMVKLLGQLKTCTLQRWRKTSAQTWATWTGAPSSAL